MDDNNIVSGAASTDVGATYSDEEFIGGFSEAFGFEPERKEPITAESENGEGEPEETPEGFVDDESEEKTTENPEEKETEAAESDEQDENVPEMVSFVESGRKFSAPKEAVEVFAKAVGRDSKSLIDIYQKGCNYDKLKSRFDEAKKTDEIFEKLAAVRKMDVEQLKAEVIASIERVPVEEMARAIQNENPGMKKEMAEELARYRIGQQKPKAETEEKSEEGSEEIAGKIREIEIFESNHPEIGKLDNEIIEAWEKTGVPLEAAYNAFKAQQEAEMLRAENERLKKEMTFKVQKEYAVEHSPGSAATAAGKAFADEFVEGLFKEY